ncbi:hypothetical protein LB507_006778 [Fusarium sp. FIESC RH6]|nr:hypothetical protein LB507_006778 [Fusarium sp. FIESC RH6]
MAQNTGQVHWIAPCSILFLFLSGILTALAHHLYYQSLDRQPITTFPQEWAIRIGTGFSFLSKACLGASAALAYQQYLWTILRSRALTVKTIDSIMGLLSDPTGFFSVRTNQNAFSCVTIAVVIWCIPLCAIAPPASLTVGAFTSEETIKGDVPYIDWAKFAWVPTGGSGMGFKDTTSETYRTVIASLYTNTILPMTPKYQNSSYSLTFDGPRLRCGDVVNQTLFKELGIAGPGGSTTTWYNATVDPPGDYRYNIFVSTTHRNFSCQVWNTTYTVDFNFANGIQKSNITKVRHLHSLKAEGDLMGAVYDDDGNMAMMGYTGWYKALTSILESYAFQRISLNTIWEISTKALQTALAACPEVRNALGSIPASSRNGCPGGSIERAFERMGEQATLSFFPSIPAV